MIGLKLVSDRRLIVFCMWTSPEERKKKIINYLGFGEENIGSFWIESGQDFKDFF